MTRRRKTSFALRCWQSLAVAVVVLSGFALLGVAADWVARGIGR